MAEKDYPKFRRFESDGEKHKRLAKMRKQIKQSRKIAHKRKQGLIPSRFDHER